MPIHTANHWPQASHDLGISLLENMKAFFQSKETAYYETIMSEVRAGQGRPILCQNKLIRMARNAYPSIIHNKRTQK